MAYQSKYTGLQIDDILDSVEYKQSKIEDLASIRAGAQKGATALQSYTEKYTGTVTGIKLNGVVKSGSGVIDLGTISTTETDPVFSASPAASITEAKKAEWDNKMDKVTLATVATSGNYNDLTNKPTIPAAVTESTVSGWGFTKNTGTYSKPSGGIPKSDLASSVQTSLGKADTALQSYTEQYKGTITGVSANGTSVATSGVANIPAASTSKYGVTKLNSSTSSTSTTEAATPSAVKSAYDLANSYKGTVTGVKVNGTTKSPSSGIVDLGYINKQLSTSTSSSMTLSPNIYYRNTSTSLSTLTITLGSVSNSNIINEYFVEFTTSSSGTTVSLPSTIKWANGEAPTFEASTTYQISIVNNLGVVTKFK